MDRLRLCLETLRRLAKETEDPSCVVLAEREINDYLQNEIDALRAALERLGRAIDEEARKGQGEDWSLMVGYVQSCLEKLPGAIDEWSSDGMMWRPECRPRTEARDRRRRLKLSTSAARQSMEKLIRET